MGGTCVNRGCVPSKALLAAAGRVREMQDGEKFTCSPRSYDSPSLAQPHNAPPPSRRPLPADHLKGFGITVGDVKYDREAVAAHAEQLVSNVAKNLGNSLGKKDT